MHRKVLVLTAVVIFAVQITASRQSAGQWYRNSSPEPGTRHANIGKVIQKRVADLQKKERGDLVVLSEGSYGQIEKPFLFIARSSETFAQLKQIVKGVEFPGPRTSIDFEKEAVVAVFSGRKNTGGHSISISRSADDLKIEAVAPAADAIVTDALTSPYKIVKFPIDEEMPVSLNVSREWSESGERFCIDSAVFSFSGGFRGMEQSFNSAGTVTMWKLGGHLTMAFDLKEAADTGNRKLLEAASGRLQGSKIAIQRLETGGFIDRPHPQMIVSGEIHDDKLDMSFSPGKRNYVINDGFEGRGKLTASRCVGEIMRDGEKESLPTKCPWSAANRNETKRRSPR